MKRILILDDMQVRHDVFRIFLDKHEVHHTYRYIECIDALRNRGPWDLVCLDHDLGDEVNDPDCMEGGFEGPVPFNGFDIALWLRANPSFCPPHVLIHSWNAAGAYDMESVILQVPNVIVLRKMFLNDSSFLSNYVNTDWQNNVMS